MSPNSQVSSFQNPEYFEHANDDDDGGGDSYLQPSYDWQRPLVNNVNNVNGVNGSGVNKLPYHQRNDSAGSNEYYNDVPGGGDGNAVRSKPIRY